MFGSIGNNITAKLYPVVLWLQPPFSGHTPRISTEKTNLGFIRDAVLDKRRARCFFRPSKWDNHGKIVIVWPQRNGENGENGGLMGFNGI